MARVATPRMLDTIAGLPASVRNKDTIVAVASPSPRSNVTITVPPAFQESYRDLFTAVDEQLELPPRKQRVPTREIKPDLADLQLESSEAFVARSYQQFEGNSSDLDRWSL